MKNSILRLLIITALICFTVSCDEDNPTSNEELQNTKFEYTTVINEVKFSIPNNMNPNEISIVSTIEEKSLEEISNSGKKNGVLSEPEYSVNITMYENTNQVLVALDNQDNVLGILYAMNGDKEFEITPTSTAVSLVLWYMIMDNLDDASKKIMRDRIVNSPYLDNLVAKVENNISDNKGLIIGSKTHVWLEDFIESEFSDIKTLIRYSYSPAVKYSIKDKLIEFETNSLQGNIKFSTDFAVGIYRDDELLETKLMRGREHSISYDELVHKKFTEKASTIYEFRPKSDGRYRFNITNGMDSIASKENEIAFHSNVKKQIEAILVSITGLHFNVNSNECNDAIKENYSTPLSNFPSFFGDFIDIIRMAVLNENSNIGNILNKCNGRDIISTHLLKAISKVYYNLDRISLNPTPIYQQDAGPFNRLDSDDNITDCFGFKNNKIVECEDIIIEYDSCEILDNNYLASTKVIQFTGKEIAVLPDCIGSIKDLEKLLIYDNDIIVLPESIGNLKKLNYLHIGGNKITQLPTSIGNLESLETLLINNNPFTSLPSSLGNLNNLKVLNLYKNRTINLPSTIGNLSSLEVLNIEYGSIQELPNNFGNLNKLERILAKDGSLGALPESFGNLTKLKFLDLEKNYINTLPVSFGNLPNLDSLILTNTNLSTLPESFANLQNLRTLKLDNNRLKSLPTNFDELPNLRWLNLNRNKFDTLPEILSTLPKLGYLEMNDNGLKVFTESFCKSSSISTLILKNNYLHSMPNNIGEMKNLSIIDFSDNGIVNMPESISNLTGLVSINLSGNEITSLPNSMNKLVNLSYLNLSNNPLKDIPYSFVDLKNLKTLDLSNGWYRDEAEKERLRKMLPNCYIIF